MGTDPTKSASYLGIRDFVAADDAQGDLVITWQSVAGKHYNVDRAFDLQAVPAFSNVWSHVAAVADSTSVTDDTTTVNGPCFYRIEIDP